MTSVESAYAPNRAIEIRAEGARVIVTETVNLPRDAKGSTPEILRQAAMGFAALRSQTIPRFLDVIATAESVRTVVELPPGRLLADEVTDRRARGGHWSRWLSWIDQISRELALSLRSFAAARPYPLVHGDLSPHSLWVTEAGGQIMTTGFGWLAPLRPLVLPLPASPFRLETHRTPPLAAPLEDQYAFGALVEYLCAELAPPPQSAADPAEQVWQRYCEDLGKFAGTLKASAERAENRIGGLVEALGRLDAEFPYRNRSLCPVCGELAGESVRFCRNCGMPVRQAAVTAGMRISYDASLEESISERFAASRFAPLPVFRLQQAIEEIESDPGFGELRSLAELPDVVQMEHQKDSVLRALRDMRGRALMADEVGLGKTIEAGIFLKELLSRRGLIKNILIVCPSALLAAQWQSELYGKFGEIFLVHGFDVGTSLAWHCDRLIATYQSLRSPFDREELLAQEFDVLVLDEAHNLNEEENEDVRDIIIRMKKRYFLLLSATPMHKSLEELYYIVTLLRPGHFADLESFRERYMQVEEKVEEKTEETAEEPAAGEQEAALPEIETEPETEKARNGTQRKPSNVGELRALLKQIMIRHRRGDAKGFDFPKRRADSRRLHLTEDGRRIYERFRTFLRERTSGIRNRRLLTEVGELVERLCSSPDAYLAKVNRLKRNPQLRARLGSEFTRELEQFYFENPGAIVQPKVSQVIELLRAEAATGNREKILLFSQFDETAAYYFRILQSTEFAPRLILYDVSQPAMTRQRAVDKARTTAGSILICPGEASEGLNLQFAGVLVNLDLPLDPMRLEQRIGRVQRIGGRPVILIVNLVLDETIEREIFEICDQTIELFKDVVGNVEDILGKLREDTDVRTLLRDVFLGRDAVDQEGNTVNPKELLMQGLSEAKSAASVEAPGSEAETLIGEIYFDEDERAEE